MDRNDHLHIMALIGETTSDVADRDGVYFFITDEISDTGFIMKTTLNLMDKDIWYRTVKDLFKQSGINGKYLRSCNSIDDTAGKAASFLNSGRDVFLLYDSRELCALVTDKVREHELHVSFHIGSLLNSME